jgi:hypothetical protein
VPITCQSLHRYFISTRLTSFSSMSQGAQCLGPRLMAPMMGTETLSPLFPGLTYSAFEFSSDFLRDGGSSDEAIVMEIVDAWN